VGREHLQDDGLSCVTASAESAPPPARARAQPSTARAVTRLIAWRVAGTAVMLAVISVLVFLLTYLSPGSIVRNLTGLHPANPRVAAQIRQEYGLNQPLAVQYLHWLGRFLQGNWGRSIEDQTSVAQLFSERVGVTLLLCAMAFILAVAVSVPLGVAAALRAGGLADRLISVTSVIGLSAPAFAVGLVLLYVFSYYLPLFPSAGAGQGLVSNLYHLTLPAITLAIGVGAYIVRLTRTAMIRELQSDYVTFARARGVGRRRVVRTALRNGVIPVITVSGLVLSFMVGATILVETTFSLPGLGLLLQSSVEFKDFPVVQFLTLAFATVIALVTLAVDLSCLALNPDWRRQLRR
jgi:peptide/nickel transport system permease protein